MKRVVVAELLDTDAGTSREVEASLKDLRMFNSWFGGVHTMSSLLRRVARQRHLQELSWVDVLRLPRSAFSAGASVRTRDATRCPARSAAGGCLHGRPDAGTSGDASERVRRRFFDGPYGAVVPLLALPATGASRAEALDRRAWPAQHNCRDWPTWIGDAARNTG